MTKPLLPIILYPMAKKIAVCGTINYDIVVRADGCRFESFGGILYNIVAIAQLSSGTEVFPVTWIGSEMKERLWQTIGNYPQVKTEGVSVTPCGTNENLLVYTSNEKRDEVLKSRVPPIAFAQIEPFLDGDLMLINFISGFELSLETLTRLRASFKGTIFMDVHSLTLGLDREGRRFERRVPGWEHWVECGDIVQANSSEAELLTGIELREEHDFQKAASAILDCGPSIVLFTLGERGCLVGYRDERRILSSLLPVRRVEVKDTTGAGDVFSAAFVVSYLEGKDPVGSAKFANLVASRSCQGMGLSGLRQLPGGPRRR